MDGSSDIDGEETKHFEEGHTAVSARRTKPRNLIKMVLEESKDAEREEKLEQENDYENSGEEFGSSAGFVQGSGETGAYHEEEHPASKPHPKNAPQASNSSSTRDVAKENGTLHNETHLHPKRLGANDQVKELNSHPIKNSDSSKIEAKVELKNKDLKSKLHKETAKGEEHSETSKAKIEHKSHVHNAELHKKSTKKVPIRVSKVSHLAKKRLHNKYVTTHVTHPHVVESHSKVVQKIPVSKGTVCNAMLEITFCFENKLKG